MSYPPRHKNPHRPYARKRGGPPSVTTVLGSMGTGDGLKWAACKLTAEFAVDFQEHWTQLGRDAAVDKLYRWHQGIWDGRAEMGTLVHAVSEAYSYGEEVDPEQLVFEAANRERRPVRQWQGRERFVVAEFEGYLDGLDQFWRDFEPDVVGTEEVVRHVDKGGHAYIGQRDLSVRLKGLEGVTLVDLKCTAKEADPANPFAGLFFEKFRLQGAAYRGAEEIVQYDDDGNETATFPAYPIARFCVLSMRGDGGYDLIECRAGGDELAHFYRLIDVWRWTTKGCKEPVPVSLKPLLAAKEVAA